jgi:molybdopterin converting factor small subunit
VQHGTGDQASSQITVRVRLHADLARHAASPTGTDELRLPAGATVGSVLDYYRLRPGRRVIVGLRDAAVDQATALADGDELDVISPMAGGRA